MPKTITINYIKVLDFAMTFVPAAPPSPASWTLAVNYTVGYQDRTGARWDHPSSVMNGKASLGVRLIDAPQSFIPSLLNQMLSAEGLSLADGDQVIDASGHALL